MTKMPARDDVLRWCSGFIFHFVLLVLVSAFASFESAVITGLAWVMTDASRCERILWRSRPSAGSER